ncbi:MAG: hypothetical protein ABIP94_03415 [Planctomycetota bacterium]
MKIRFAAALLALALPLTAQAPASAEAEGIFYKAFWLEKGERDLIGAMALYEQFLAKAPEHKLAKEAAKQQFGLLSSTGKTKERDAFKVKYEKLLGNVASVGAGGDRPARAEGDAPPAGGERGQRGEGAGRAGGAARMDPAARMAELEKQLAKAKEEGDDEATKRVEQQIERAKRMAEGGGRGQGGQPGQGRRGGMGALFGTKKLSEMTAEELKAFKDGLAGAETMLEGAKGRMGEEDAKKLDANVSSLKKGLDANKLDDAQKALDAIRESMPRGRGRGGDAGGGNNGGGAGRAGGGGNNGGGGGNNGGGGGR